MAQVKVTLVKSLAGRPGDQRATIVALGLHKTNSSVVKEVTPQMIKTTVAEYYSIPVESLLSERRDREIVLPRQLAMYLCHDMLGIPYKRISSLFDKNDHTTAINACKRVEEMIESESSFATVIEDIKKRMM